MRKVSRKRNKSNFIKQIERFYRWYFRQIKESPLLIIIGSILALFSLIGSAYGGIQALESVRDYIEVRYFENSILYQKLEKINIGLAIEFAESIIGEPTIVKNMPLQLTDYTRGEDGRWVDKDYPSGLEDYVQRIYVHEKYFLQIITDSNKSIVSYAITTRDKGFNPKFPVELITVKKDDSGDIITEPYIENLRIGKMAPIDLKEYKPEHVNIGSWGQLYFYVEALYFGRPGFYKHYLLGLSHTGYYSDEEMDSKVTDLGFDKKEYSPKDKEIVDLRKEMVPNTFGVINGYEHKDLFDYFIKEGIGVNYYDIWELK